MKRYIQRIVRSVVLLTILPCAVFACDVCGAFIGVTPYDNQSGFSVFHRYSLHSRIDNLEDQPIFPSGAYRVVPVMSALHSSHDSVQMQPGDFESFKTIEVRGKWFIHNRVEINTQLPFVFNRMRSNTHLERISGVGDVSCWIGVHVVRKLETDLKQRLVIGLGVKIPTGRCDVRDESGVRFHLYMQPGSGTFQESAYIQYSLSRKKIGLFWNGTVKRNGINSFDEQVKASFTSGVNLFYMIKKGNAVVLPQIQIYAEYCSGYTVNQLPAANSEIGMVMSGIGCDAYFGRLGTHLTVQIPAVQIRSTEAPGASLRGAIGISWNINQQKFLIN